MDDQTKNEATENRPEKAETPEERRERWLQRMRELRKRVPSRSIY